jgi:hypothetical protein
MDATGKVVMESILETKAATIVEFFAGLRGTLSVTFEEGTWSVWLYDLLNPRVDKLVVCNPRKNALLKDGSKSDRIDARKLAELLRGNQLKPVYHGETWMQMLREPLSSGSRLTNIRDMSNSLTSFRRLRLASCYPTSCVLPRNLSVDLLSSRRDARLSSPSSRSIAVEFDSRARQDRSLDFDHARP